MGAFFFRALFGSHFCIAVSILQQMALYSLNYAVIRFHPRLLFDYNAGLVYDNEAAG